MINSTTILSSLMGLFFIVLPISPRLGELRMDYLLLPVIYFFILVVTAVRMRIDWSSIVIFAMFVFFPLLITVFSKLYFGNGFVLKDFFYYFGAFRFFAVFYATYLLLELKCWDQGGVQKIVIYVSAIVCFFGMLEFFNKDLSYVLQNYYSNPRDVELIENQLTNMMARAISTVGHPSTLAFFSLILISYSLNPYKDESIKKVLLLGVAILAGIATYSKIFLLGLSILLLYRAVFISQKYLLPLILLAPCLLFLSSQVVDYSAQFHYLLDTIVNRGLEGILFTRLGDEGNLHKPLEVLSDTYYIGIGSDSTLGVVKSDSLFITMALLSGLVGLLIFTIYWIREGFFIYRKVLNYPTELWRERFGLLLTLDFLVMMFCVGVGYNPLFGDRLLEVSALILANGAYLLRNNDRALIS